MGVATVAALQVVVGAVSPVVAHHPGGGTEPLVLIDRRKDGYRTILEVFPPDPVAGSSTQFMLWVRPERWGYQYRGTARLSLRDQSSPSARPMVLTMPEEGRGAGVYLVEHRFDRAGTYRVEVELADVPARWGGTLHVGSAAAWLVRALMYVAFAGLVVAFVVFLHWWSGPQRTPS